jgi:hypothetical protein
MLGSIQDYPLVVPRLLDCAEPGCWATEVVSRLTEADICCYTSADMTTPTRQLADALAVRGLHTVQKLV